MKKVLLVALVLTMVVGGYLAFTTVDTKVSVATAAKQTYAGTTYVAGMGGHFTKANFTIDPNNADDPIKMGALDRIVIGDKTSHPTHDARIDSEDANILFWSTYVLDANKKQHVGKTDLKTGKVIFDKAMDPDPRSKGEKPPVYCASGQSKANYLPIFMGNEGYVDVFDKKTMDHKKRIFVDGLGYKAGSYVFVHGTNSNDMKKFLISMTMKGDDGKANGAIDFILVDLPAMEKGEWKVLAKATHKGEPGKTITFRMYFSPDDKLIFQSAADRFWLLDAKDLKMVDEKMTKGQNHDAQPTPDGKYAILTLRTSDTDGCDIEGKPIMKDGAPVKITDGTIQIYDVDAKKIIGKQASVCFGCHKGMGLGDKSAVLCGLDTTFKK